MKIKFIVLTCEKYHKSRVEKIRQNWGFEQNLIFLSDINQGDDIIGFDYLPKGYENIHYKYAEFFKTNTDFSSEWYFFTDDDTFVNINNIKELIQQYDSSSPICIGHYGRLNSDGTDMNGNQTGFPLHTISGQGTYLPIDYPSGGAGFILSLESVKLIKNYLKNLDENEIPRCYNSDVTIGFWMRSCGIKNNDIDGFWWTNPVELKHDESEIKSSFTYHYMDEKLMDKVYNL